MNKEVKEKWVAALRSGKYKQGKHALRMDDQFCCLGVLCDLATQEGVIEQPDQIARKYSYQGSVLSLPRQVTLWAGVNDNDPYFIAADGSRTYVSYLNDRDHLFTEIAEIIEEQL